MSGLASMSVGPDLDMGHVGSSDESYYFFKYLKILVLSHYKIKSFEFGFWFPGPRHRVSYLKHITFYPCLIFLFVCYS